MRRNSIFCLGIVGMMVLGGCSLKSASVDGIEVESTKEVRSPLVISSTESSLPEFSYYERNEFIEKNGRQPSYLTGELVDVKEARKRPVAVMISNDKAALPQYGINHAKIVYEAPVEGNMNRFLALFDDYSGLERIGSVRSARTYYIYFAKEFDAILFNYGQSTFAKPYLAKIDHVNGVEGIGGQAYFRSKDKKSPHNAYTSSAKIDKAIETSGYQREHEDTYQSRFLFAKDGSRVTLEEGVDAYKVVPGYSLNTPYFVYNEVEQVYERYQYDQLHMGRDGAVVVENILIQYCKVGNYENTEYLNIDLHSGGDGYFITNGKAIPVTWKKEGEQGRTYFYNEQKEEIILNQGKTWFCIIPTRDILKTEIYGKQ